jgi:hypothetical protein
MLREDSSLAAVNGFQPDLCSGYYLDLYPLGLLLLLPL